MSTTARTQWQRRLNALAGLPLVYVGIALLTVHCLCHLRSNALLLIALALEIVGVGCHYWRMKHRP